MSTTKSSQDAPAGVSIDGATSYSPSGTEVVEHAPEPGYDKFSVLPHERKAFGIEDSETVAWVRNPSNWEKIEHSDRIREFSRERPGARVVGDTDGDMVTNGDLVLMAYPSVHKEREEAARTHEYEEHAFGEAPDTRPRDRDRLRHAGEQMHRQHEREGTVGPASPTSGMSYEAALSKYTTAQIDSEEARYRRGTRQQSFDSDDWADMIDGGRARGQARSTKKSVSMGDSGLGKTTAQRLAERQQPRR